jgi:UDP-N-acetylglucosamine 2-epimerase
MCAPAKVLTIVGAWPTLVKIASLVTGVARHPGIRPILIPKQGYYREAMSDQLFTELHVLSAA